MSDVSMLRELRVTHRSLRYLVAPDNYNCTHSAAEAADAIAQRIRCADPGAVVTELPFAGGGEGTVDAVVASGGEKRWTRVQGITVAPLSA